MENISPIPAAAEKPQSSGKFTEIVEANCQVINVTGERLKLHFNDEMHTVDIPTQYLIQIIKIALKT